MQSPLASRSTSKGLYALVLAAGLTLPGCGSLGYLIQAGEGQLELSNKAKPIDQVVQDERTPPRIKNLLSQIAVVKSYGETQGLKPTKNYTEYVQLDRSAAVYVVSACEPLKFESKEWHFPIVGSFPYLGWFNRDKALSYAEGLRKEGWDVDVRDAAAFSTLGWFRDAVLSTMISDGDDALGELVNVVIHESTHATVYINGQSTFNESLANYVAGRMTPQYLDHENEEPEKKAYLESESEYEVRTKEFHEAYEKLDALYSSAQSDDEKRKEKAEILSKLKEQVGFKREINNATLIQFRTYNTSEKDFEALYEKCGQDWKRFLSRVGTLKSSSFGKEQQEDVGPAVRKLAEGGC